ncbi:hypothetical protein, partial [Burkholderia sp. SIMBA_052]|uniref:hypothetical protein n=1 Tax=Burkholderia sp. SIMBA_052 TaxID=3085793 RepID=UPI00397DF081
FHAAAKTIAGSGTANLHWWPNQLRVDLLNQHSQRSNPLGEQFDYRAEFKKLVSWPSGARTCKKPLMTPYIHRDP